METLLFKALKLNKHFRITGILLFFFLSRIPFAFAQKGNDLKIKMPVAIAPYKIWQKDQLYAFSGMANAINKGIEPFKHPKLKLNIYDGDFNLIWSDSTKYYKINTPMPRSFYPPNKLGKYSGVYTISQDAIDTKPSDNYKSFSWKVDNNIMSKEDIGEKGKGLTPNADINFTWGNVFHIEKSISSDGHKLKCNEIQVGIGNANELPENSFIVYLYKWDNKNGDEIVDEWERTLVGYSNLDFIKHQTFNTVYTLVLVDFIILEPGVFLEDNTNYILAAQYIATVDKPNLRCYILADTKLDYSLNKKRDSLIKGPGYYNHVLDIGNTGNFSLKTLNTNAVPVLRMVISPQQ